MVAREFSFTSFQVNNPTAPPPGDRLDGEFDRLAKTIAAQPPPPPAKIGKNQLEPGLFKEIGAVVASRVEALAATAQALLAQVHAAAVTAFDAVGLASTHNAQAQDAATRSSSEAHSASASALAAAASADQAEAFYVETGNAARDTAGDVAVCQDYADVTQAWAEYLPGPIPPNILAVMGITGDHWSSRFWANQAAQIFDAHHLGPQGPAGPTGATGAQGPPGTGSVAGMVAGQIPIAASATGIASSVATLAASFMPAHTGDVTSPAGSIVNTLATVNGNVGTFNNLTVNAKGLVTAASNAGYMTSSGVSGMVAGQIPIAASATTIVSSSAVLPASFMPAHTGDVTSPASSTVNTLATVNSNVGTFQGLTVNAKGLVTAAANQSYVTGGPYLPTSGGTLTGVLAVAPGADANPIVRIAGLTKAVRLGASSTSAAIDGVDQTGAASYQPLTLGGTTVQFGGPGGVQIGTPTGGDKGAGTLNAVGVYANNVLLTSDASLKRDIAGLPDCLPIVLAIAPKSYRLELPLQLTRQIDGTEHQITLPSRQGWGFIAQEVEAGTKGHGFPGVEIGVDGLRSLSHGDLTAVLWQAVREMSQRIVALEAAR